MTFQGTSLSYKYINICLGLTLNKKIQKAREVIVQQFKDDKSGINSLRHCIENPPPLGYFTVAKKVKQTKFTEETSQMNIVN